MKLRSLGVLLFATALVCVLFACNGDKGSDVRTLAVVAHDAGCMPTAFVVEPGRYVQLRLENGSNYAFALRDREDRFAGLTAESGETTEALYRVPDGVGEYTLLCASDGGVQTEIKITTAVNSPANRTTEAPSLTTSVAVSLADFTITPSDRTLSSGTLTFIATNASSESVHEINVLELQEDGSFVKVAGIAPIPPEAGGSMTVALQPGTYRLACQIGIGESGSTVDHYQQGMWVDINVE